MKQQGSQTDSYHQNNHKVKTETLNKTKNNDNKNNITRKKNKNKNSNSRIKIKQKPKTYIWTKKQKMIYRPFRIKLKYRSTIIVIKEKTAKH